MKRTEHYDLPTWEKTDRIMMDDFNDMTAKLDAALKVLADLADSMEKRIPKIVVGSYVGDGQETREIQVGFTPKMVLVMDQGGHVYYSDSAGLYHAGGMAFQGNPAKTSESPDNMLTILALTETGFCVSFKKLYNLYVLTNNADVKYHYLVIG